MCVIYDINLHKFLACTCKHNNRYVFHFGTLLPLPSLSHVIRGGGVASTNRPLIAFRMWSGGLSAPGGEKEYHCPNDAESQTYPGMVS